MRKLMIGAFAALAAAVTARADGELFRYSADGTDWTAAETLAAAIEGVPAGGIVELTGDATYDTEITITKNVTIRSAAGATYTLKRTEPVTIMVGNGGAANVTVTNLVWDGGAVWTYSHEDANSEATYRANTGVANAILVKAKGASKNIAELHLVNVKVTNAYSMDKGAVIDAGQYANLWLETGTLVTDCRGDYIVYQSSSDNDVYFDGECEIVGNFARTAVFFNANTSDTQYYHFRACTVTNNITRDCGNDRFGYPTGYAFNMPHYVRGHLRVGKPTEEGGRVIFRDNFCTDKTTERNIMSRHNTADGSKDGRFVLEGSLTADSEVRAMPDTIGDTIADGSVFGSVASGVEAFHSVSRIVTDAAWTGEKMYACVKNGKLVWSTVPQKDTFVSDDFGNAYSSFAEAVAATPDGGRLWLSGVVPVGEGVSIAGKSLKLDLSGRSLGASVSVVLGEKGGLTLVDSKRGEVTFAGTIEVAGSDAKLHLGPGVYTGSPAVCFTESAKDAAFYAGGATFVSATGAALEFAGTGDWDLGGVTVTGADGVKVSGGTLTLNDAAVDVTGTGVLCDKGANAVEVRQDNETAVVKGGVAAYATTVAFDAAVAAGSAYGDVSGGSVSSVVPGSLLDGYTCTQEDDAIVFTPVGNAVRFSDDGGENWVEYASFDDFMDVAARTSHTTTNWVVELLRDCKVSKMVTWSNHASDCWIVIRSDSRQGHRHVLQIAAEGAKRMFVVQNNTHVFDLRFRDVVLDGGAVYSQRWLDPMKSSDELLAHGGVTIDQATVFNLNGAGGYVVAFARGATVRNFCGTAFAYSVGNTVLRVEEGSRLTGMRINGVMFSTGSWNSDGCFRMEGGRIDHCYFVGNGGLCNIVHNGAIGLHLNGGEITENLFTTYMLYADGRVDFTGTRIVGNTCQRNSTSYEETYSICWIPNKSGAGCEVSGNPVCWDNYNLAGLNVGLSAQAKPIIVTGALGRGARVRFMCPNGQNLSEGGVVSHDGNGPSYILNGVDPRGLSHIYNTQTDLAKDICWVAKRSDVDMLDGTAKKLVYTKPSVCLEPGMVKSAASSAPTLFLTQISRDLKAGRLDVTGTLTLTDTVLELGADVGTLENFKGGVVIPLATAGEIVGFDAFSAANVAALDLPRHWSLQVLPTDNGRQQLCLRRRKQGLILIVR